MKIPLFRSLRFKMPLLVLAGTVPLILISILYASNRAAERIREEGKENLAFKADLLAEGVNQWKNYKYLTLKNLSQQPQIAGANLTDRYLILKRLTENYQDIYLGMTVDTSGYSIARSDNREPQYYGDRVYIKRSLDGEDITYQAVVSRTNGKPAVCMGTPIGDRQTQILGAVAICSNLEISTQQVTKLQFGNTGYGFVVNELGEVLAHSEPEFILGDELKDFSQNPPVQRILDGDSGLMFYTDNEGIEWISYYVRLDSGWGVVVNQQTSEFFQSEREFLILGFLIAAVTVVGVSIVTWLVANQAIAPISTLSDAATAIASGQWNRKVSTKRKDELGVLAQSFNQMALQLKILFKNLQKRIDQRTNELEEAKQLAQQAQQTALNASKTRDRFLSNFSRELQTPIDSILGHIKIIKKDLPGDSERLENLKIIEQSGNHLSTLINDIVYFSNSETTQIQLIENNFQLATCLDEVLNIIRLPAEQKNLQISKEYDDLPRAIRADEKRLRQVLVDMLSNAVKFSHKGEITLKARAIDSPKNDRQTLRFEVNSNSIGMSQEELETLLQPFERLGGLNRGLGLSIAKDIVQLMGGKLQIESKVRKGASFWFEIRVPVVEVEEEEQPPETIQGEIIGYKGRIQNILVVDDKEENRDLLLKILQPLGFEVLTANNGEHMIEMVSKFQTDLILLDLFMPVKTGFISAREIRQMPEFSNIPIIVVTASAITKEMGDSIDCDAILHKPVDEEELLDLLQRYLNLEWIYRDESEEKKEYFFFDKI